MDAVKEYIVHKLFESDEHTTCLKILPDFDSINYFLIRNAQPTSAAGERSFSMDFKIVGAED